jgi:hypothetical protein
VLAVWVIIMKIKLILRSALCLIPLLLNANCVAQKPLQSTQLTDYFINANEAAQDSLQNCRATLQQFDSLVSLVHSAGKGSAGTFSLGMEPYNILGWKTPDTIRQDTTYPLIIYLHGGTGCPLPEKGIRAWDMLTPLADTFQLFIASPSADRNTPWWSADGLERILQTVRFMSLHYPINPDKIFLAGVSDGATGCYAAMNTIPGPFAGFIAVSGFGGMLPQTGMTLVPQNIAQRPVYNVNAGKDRIFPIAYVLHFLDWLKENGVIVEHREYPNEEHGFDYRPKEFGTLAHYIRTWSHSSSSSAHTINHVFVRGFPINTDNVVDVVLDSAAESSAVEGQYANDTLTLIAHGLRELVVSFPDKKDGILYVRSNGARCMAVSPQQYSVAQYYRQMLHSCMFLPCSAATYTIRIKKD